MAGMTPLPDNDVVYKLARGFEALLKQVDELKRHREGLERLLSPEQKEILSDTESDEVIDREIIISDGIVAWKTYTDHLEGTAEIIGRSHQHAPIHSPERTAKDKDTTMPKDHPPRDSDLQKTTRCPFASMAPTPPDRQKNTSPTTLMMQRPDSMPTPPDPRNREINKPALTPSRPAQLSPPPSVNGSFSKCPIRMLDDRPPEEIAEYFETHKHEIPRSHEICVKRYQSNEQSIRQLDAKYGSLVNMIQGLGLKHQPMLHTRDEAEEAVPPKSKVEAWTDDVNPAIDDADVTGHIEHGAGSAQNREGHFDRPLKEIRVGESPSRPWGISVPAAAAKSFEDHTERFISTEDLVSPTPAKEAAAEKSRLPDQSGERPRMIFTGPVFIGYAPDQAAAFIKQHNIGV